MNQAVGAKGVCYTNVIWAKETGITENPSMYMNYTTLTTNSSLADFQCALYGMKGGDESGTGWNCTKPCTSTIVAGPGEMCEVVSTTLATTTTPGTSSSSSFPWWAWLLVVLALLAVI